MGAVVQILDTDEDPKSIEARAQEELRVTLSAQQRFNLQRSGSDLLEKAKEYRKKYNLTLEVAIQKIIQDENIK
jgi:hypothetical protein